MSENIRDKDNFRGAYDYLTTQLLPYDYNNQSELDGLKLKTWVLDGAPLVEETTVVETDILDPVDHLRWLKSEINTADLWIRTEEDTLLEGEDNFKSIQKNKRVFLKEIKKEINVDTGERWKDYEVDYESRPTLLTEEELKTLHIQFIDKRTSGELDTFPEVLTNIPENNLDQFSSFRESSVINYVDTDTQEAQILAQALSDQDREDKQLVTEMGIVYDEMFDLIKTLAPSILTFDAWDTGTTYDKGDIVEFGGDHYLSIDDSNMGNEPEGGKGSNWIQFGESWDSGQLYQVGSQVEKGNDLYLCIVENTNFDPSQTPDKWRFVDKSTSSEYTQVQVIANFPTKRAQVVMLPDDDSHRGIYITNHTIGGGFRYGYIQFTDGTQHNPDGNGQSEEGIGISGDLWDENELTMSAWRVAEFLYIDGSDNFYYDTNLTRSNLPSIIDSAQVEGSVSVERNDELVSRWETLNHFREANLQGTGTRIALEGMVSAQVPELLTDFETSFEETKQLKGSVINILKERFIEFT